MTNASPAPVEVETMADPAPFNLFDVCSWTEVDRPAKDKPRVASHDEITAYAAHLARQADLQPFEHAALNHGHGVTFGRRLSAARSEPVEVPDYETLTVRVEYVAIPEQYEEGAYSVPLPGRSAHHQTVTMETLDEAGNVVSTSTMPLEPRKGGIVWDKASVRRAVGPIAKPRRKAPTASAPLPAADGYDKLADYVAAVAGTRKWCVARRLGSNMAARYDVAITPARYEAIKTEWEKAHPEVSAASTNEDLAQLLAAVTTRLSEVEKRLAEVTAQHAAAPAEPASGLPVEPDERAELEAEIDRLRESVSLRDQVIRDLRGDVAMLMAKRERTAGRMRKLRKDARNGWAMSAIETRRASELQRQLVAIHRTTDGATAIERRPLPESLQPSRIVLPAVASRPREAFGIYG